MAHAPAELVTAEPVLPPANGKWSDLLVRFASAAVLGPLALLALWYGGIAWAMLIGLAMAGLGLEWARLAGFPGRSMLPVLVLVAWELTLFFGIVAGFVTIIAITLFAAWRFGRFAAAGMPYIAVGGLSLLWLRLSSSQGLHDTLFLVVVIWSTDIGAYLVGRVFGGARLAPKISPGKTWSGAMGGLASACLAGYVVADFQVAALPAAVCLSVFAQSGDLLESAIKRRLGVKDSGRTIPGHGGLFDRLDGFLAAAPVAAILALIAPGGLPVWH